MEKFELIQIRHVPRSKNASADTLANLAIALVLPDGQAKVKIEERWLLPAVLELVSDDHEVNTVVTTEVDRQD